MIPHHPWPSFRWAPPIPSFSLPRPSLRFDVSTDALVIGGIVAAGIAAAGIAIAVAVKGK